MSYNSVASLLDDVEKRFANDGVAYSYVEFADHYADQAARRWAIAVEEAGDKSRAVTSWRTANVTKDEALRLAFDRFSIGGVMSSDGWISFHWALHVIAPYDFRAPVTDELSELLAIHSPLRLKTFLRFTSPGGRFSISTYTALRLSAVMVPIDNENMHDLCF
jgi:hypothetical protein